MTAREQQEERKTPTGAARANAEEAARERLGSGFYARSPDIRDEALAAAVEKHESALLRYVSWLTDPNDAEDIVQEAFLRLHQEWQKPGKEIRNEKAFLFRAAHNLSIDNLRRKRVRDDALREATQLSRQLTEDSPEPLKGIVSQVAADRAVEELMQLPGTERRIVFLKIVQEFSLRDIAEITGIALSSVAYKLSAGLGIMARRLEDAGVI